MASNNSPRRQGGKEQAGPDKPFKNEVRKVGERQIQVKIKVPSTEGIPIEFANGVLSNFVGNQFYITIFSAVPEPFSSGEQPDFEHMVPQVLARYAFHPDDWTSAVESLYQQLERLRAEGIQLGSGPKENE